jgi:hypothetical protein
MSRNISWIREIWNNTKQPYTIWCWDTDNEGLYIDVATNKHIGKNDGGQPVTIQPGQHVVTSGGSCGIPDGGDKNGLPKRRVFFAGVPGAKFENKVGPRGGLRLNRTKVDDNTDQILYTDEGTGTFIGRMTFPSTVQQTLNVVINPPDAAAPGIVLNIVEGMTSTEAKWDKFVADTGQWLATTLGDLASEALKAAATAAMAA